MTWGVNEWVAALSAALALASLVLNWLASGSRLYCVEGSTDGKAWTPLTSWLKPLNIKSPKNINTRSEITRDAVSAAGSHCAESGSHL